MTTLGIASILFLSKLVRVRGLRINSLVFPNSVSYESLTWSRIAAVASLSDPLKEGQVAGDSNL